MIESKFDLLIINSSSHVDSWISSLFNETRKIISNLVLSELFFPSPVETHLGPLLTQS